MVSDEEMKYLKEKRLKVLETIKPICEAFEIKDYDYIVQDTGQREALRIYKDKIGCSCSSISVIIDELIGWIFVKLYCSHRSIGAFEKQTLNVIKQYWKKENKND